MARTQDMNAEPKAPRMLPPWAQIMLGVGLCLLLVVLVPSRDELRDRILSEGPDQLSITYLQLDVSEAPHDQRMRFFLARQYYQLSRYNEALATLAPLLDDESSLGHKARLLAIEVEHARCTSVGSQPRPVPASCSLALAHEIRALVHRGQSGAPLSRLSSIELERMAEISMANHAPALAGELYEVLAEEAGDMDERIAWQEKAAFAFTQGEHPERAAALYAEIARALPAPQAEPYVTRALGTMRAANRPEDALAIALAELERAPRSRHLLESAIAVALSAGRPEVAAELGRRLLVMRPNDPAMITRQLAAELAIGALDRALPLARRLVELEPDNLAAREQLAQVAEWSGQPLDALEEWTWLAYRTDDPRRMERAIALARMYWDQELLLSLTLRAAELEPLGRDQWLEVAELELRLGRPERARAIIDRLLAQAPAHRPSWDARLRVQLAMVDIPGAAATWAEIAARFGLHSEAEARAFAELLWRERRAAEALALLEQEVSKRAGAVGPAARLDALMRAEEATLRSMAELSWQLERLELAELAYEALWRRQQATALELERLFLVARATGRTELALTVTEELWRRDGRPETLLRAMQLAAAGGRWADVARLEELAERAAPGDLATRAEYWRLRIARRQELLRAMLERSTPDKTARERTPVQRAALDRAAQICMDIAKELEQAGQRSPEFAAHADFHALWIDLRAQELYLALERGDVAAAERALDASDALDKRPAHWYARFGLLHAQLKRSVDERDFARAGLVLATMEQYLARAREWGVPDEEPDYVALRDDVHRQKLYVALARGDLDTAARLIDAMRLPDADRVRVLWRLGRYEDASEVALAAEDRAALAGDIDVLTRRLNRQAGGHVRMVTVDNMRLLEVGGGARYAWDTLGVAMQVVGRQVDAASGMLTEPVREAEIWATGRWHGAGGVTEIGLGGNLGPDSDALMLAGLAHSRNVGELVAVDVRGGLGQSSEEGGLLRMLAKRDYVQMRLGLSGETGLFGTIQGSGQWYRSREDELVGTGVDAHLGLGYRDWYRDGEWNVRLLGGAAMRACTLGQLCGLPDALVPSRRDGLIALAAGVANGEPGQAATPVSRLTYAAELVGGWLVLDERLVYSAVLRIGLPIAGGDELTVSAEIMQMAGGAGIGALSGTRQSVMFGYARSLWR